MSGGNETLMRTRCPECATVFRVTSEQLRQKAGKVRCGHCQAVFNAFDHWQAEGHEENPVEQPVADISALKSELAPALTEPEASAPAVEAVEFDSAATIVVGSDWRPAEDLSEAPPPFESPEPVDWPVAEPTAMVEAIVEHEAEIPQEVQAPEAPPAFDAGETLVAMPSDRIPVYTGEPPALLETADAPDETPEQSAQAAREAGLVAARELADTTSYNRWAAGTLASDGRGVFDGQEPKRARWPFVVVAILLFITLLAQMAHHFRSELVLRLPSLAAAYEALGIAIPLPRNPALVSIETSDLQSDNARGLFVLQATLKNRAAYAQAWPALELSLTDTNDAVVARRVMYAAEYLPPGTTADSFPPNVDIAVRLWIEAKQLGASGYRLYIFYP